MEYKILKKLTESFDFILQNIGINVLRDRFGIGLDKQ